MLIDRGNNKERENDRDVADTTREKETDTHTQAKKDTRRQTAKAKTD